MTKEPIEIKFILKWSMIYNQCDNLGAIYGHMFMDDVVQYDAFRCIICIRFIIKKYIYFYFQNF